MLLMPTVVAALAGALAMFQLGLLRLELSQLAFYEARSQAIGNPESGLQEVAFESKTSGQLLCVTATKKVLFEIRESGCYLIHGA